MLEQNRQALDHDYYTDILTWPLQYEPIHSEILISIERVQDHAQERQIPWMIELARVLAHGVLHMCGHLDETDSQRTAMRALEDQYLRRLD